MISLLKALNIFNCTGERIAEDESLAEHDKKYHGGHYDPETQSCGKRDEMGNGDKSDSVGAENGEKRVNGVTEAEDAAYMDAVKRPDANERTMRLAPNGKRSNLTNALYHLVRTKWFKDWFGDWERYVLGNATESDCKSVVKNWRDARKEFRNKANGRVAEPSLTGQSFSARRQKESLIITKLITRQ